MKKKTIVITVIIILVILITFIFKHTPNNENNDLQFNENIENNVIKNNYNNDGFSIQLSITNAINPSIIIINNKDTIAIELLNISENHYEANIITANLENGQYKIYVKDEKNASPVINKLDLLEQLVRAKTGNKLITFDYTKDNMTFKIEDFKYEYDILIDPGHGGIDAGTINNIINEADFNLLQSTYEKKRYEEHGLRVLMARENDGDGMLNGNNDWNRAKQRGYAIGYYGVTSKIIYSNHHNSTVNANTSGFEILVSNSFNYNDLETELKIMEQVIDSYPTTLINNKYLIYSRDYDTGNTYNKINAKIYNYRDYYATIRIPLELYNVKTVTYEGCYMSNKANFNWYYKNEGWKIISEIKIKNYVEALGKTYIPI